MQILEAQHTHNTTFVPAMPTFVIDLSCDSCNLNKASSAPRNRIASQKHAAPLQNLFFCLWGPVGVPSPYGMRYCLLAIDHHTNFTWVRFLNSNDKTCSQMETILQDARNIHARCHSQLGGFARFIKFDSDYVFNSAETQFICTRLEFNTKFSTPYTHHMLGKAERPWRRLRHCASSVQHAMFVPNSMWSCAISTVVHMRNRTFSGAVGRYVGLLPLSSRVSFPMFKLSECLGAWFSPKCRTTFAANSV
jgi:hypothetical protein